MFSLTPASKALSVPLPLFPPLEMGGGGGWGCLARLRPGSASGSFPCGGSSYWDHPGDVSHLVPPPPPKSSHAQDPLPALLGPGLCGSSPAAGRTTEVRRHCVNSPPLCLSGKLTASPGQTPPRPSAEPLLCSRPCRAPLCLGCVPLSSQPRPAAPWDPVTGGSVSSPASCARSLLLRQFPRPDTLPSSSPANSSSAFKSQLQPKSPLGPSPRTGVWG